MQRNPLGPDVQQSELAQALAGGEPTPAWMQQSANMQRMADEYARANPNVPPWPVRKAQEHGYNNLADFLWRMPGALVGMPGRGAMQRPQAIMNEAGDIGRPAIMGQDAATGIRAYMNRNPASSQRDGMFVGGKGYPEWRDPANVNEAAPRFAVIPGGKIPPTPNRTPMPTDAERYDQAVHTQEMRPALDKAMQDLAPWRHHPEAPPEPPLPWHYRLIDRLLSSKFQRDADK